MAQRKTTSSNRPSSRSGSSSKATASSRSSKSQKALPPEPEKEPLWVVIWSYSWGKALYLLLAVLVLIGLDFLISMNRFDRFFTVLGIEIIVAMISGWIVFLFLDRKKQKESADWDTSETDDRD